MSTSAARVEESARTLGVAGTCRRIPHWVVRGQGPNAPHPFYISGPKERADMVLFLQGLDTHNSVRQGETR